MPISRSTPDVQNRIPLIIEPDNRDDTTSKDAKIVNCYVETIRSGKSMEVQLFKRPGLSFNSQPTGGVALGLGTYNWQGHLYSIFGTTFFKDGVSKGTVDGSGIYHFSSNLGLTPKLQLGNGVAAYNYDDANGLVQIVPTFTVVTAGSFVVGQTYVIATIGSTNFTLIGAASNTVGISFVASGAGSGTGTATVSGFPALFVKGWAFLDETTYVMDGLANIQGSELNNTVIWNPLNVLQAQIEPDGGVALAKQLVNVIALKQWTTEVFYDAGNATGSPLGRVEGAKGNVGCWSSDSVQDIDGVLLWVATTRVGTISVVMMDNLKITTVSTKAVERLLDDVLPSSLVYSWQLKSGQHKFYGVTFKGSNLTLVFDLTERRWAQWTDINGNYFPFVSSAVDGNMNHVIQHETNGKLYFMDDENLNDDGVPIAVDIYTPNYDAGVRNRKYVPRIEVIGDQVSGSTIQIRHSDDDYQSWSNFRTVNMSLRRPFLQDCGTFYTRAYHLRHRANTRMRIQAVELQVALGPL